MRKTKILIVDDKSENILALANLIAAPDVEIVSAISGNEALEMLLKHDVALALLDVQMPVISGFELARLMRSAERSRSIPIIFVTASQGTAAAIFEGYEHGAVDYLTKPLDPHIVRSKVRVFVELDQRTHALHQKTEALAQKLREVETLRDAAEAANRAKSRFLANMSHEIRTPLGAVLGFSELIKIQEQSEVDRQSCILGIERNGKILLKLIDDILDLSKIEADRIEAERVNCSLTEILHDLEIVHGLKASEQNIDLSIVPMTDLPRYIVTDPIRLKQILNNIIGNAIKFTSKGSVKVEVYYSAAADNSTSCLKFLVIDTGHGLTEAETERLFQPFIQADSSTRRRFGGTGLGLVISKSLAQLLGGDVVLKATAKDIGSTFQITIDSGESNATIMENGVEFLKTLPNPALTQKRDSKQLAGVSILVVDDSPDNRLLLSRILQHEGAKVDLAEDGQRAVEMALTDKYMVVLMDIQMPIMDGYEATARLRQKGYHRPIIALTAHAMREELERCLKAGCDHHISKPVDRALLLNLLMRCLGEIDQGLYQEKNTIGVRNRDGLRLVPNGKGPYSNDPLPH